MLGVHFYNPLCGEEKLPHGQTEPNEKYRRTSADLAPNQSWPTPRPPTPSRKEESSTPRGSTRVHAACVLNMLLTARLLGQIEATHSKIGGVGGSSHIDPMVSKICAGRLTWRFSCPLRTRLLPFSFDLACFSRLRSLTVEEPQLPLGLFK